MQDSPASDGEDSPRSRNIAIWAVAVYLVAFLPRVLRAWEPREDILRRSTPDDAYYYFGIARNIIEGNGVSFDGEHVTNGFHPLWQALITPLWVFGGDVPIHLALTLGAICGGITAALVFLFLHRATAALLPSLLGAGFFALHPQIVTDSVNGLESAVTVMLLAALLLALLYVDFAQGRGRSPSAMDAGFGVLCGLLMLARTDMVFVVAAVLLYVLVRMGRRQALRPVAMGMVATLCVLPWFAWSLIATGSLMQISGRAGGVYFRDAYIAEHGDALSTRAKHGLEVARTVFTEELPQSYFVPEGVPEWALLFAACIVVGIIACAAYRARGRYADAAFALAIVAIGLGLGLAFHGGVRWFTRSWYYTPAALVGAVALGMVVHGGLQLVRAALPEMARSVHERAGWVACGAIALLLVIAYEPYDAMSWGGENEGTLIMHDAGRWLADNTAADARAGSFNGGIIGYYSDRTVLNLDGVVNEDAYHAIVDCSMTAYVRDEELDYVVDFSQALRLAYCGPPVVTYEQVFTVQGASPVFGVIDVVKVVPVQE